MPTTVDKIRSALEKRDGIAEEEMRPLAESYRSEVQAVNQRLDDAVMLLRKGLRSEAIQRVEMTPNALDAAADLDFPEWDDWNEILQFMGIPLPPRLNHEYVAQINEAIIESLPLDALLRRHRRLAIAKAPLSARLRTLRQIARVDSSNRVWNEDVESWEKVRLQQIDAELRNALEDEDARRLYDLHRELTGDSWQITPAPRLIEQSAFAAEAHVRQNQEAELGKLAPQLNQAFQNRDETAGRSLRSQWQSIRSKYSVPVPSHLEQSIAPAMSWLEDLDRQSVMESERQMAIQRLETALDENHSILDVKQAFEEASRFTPGVPEDLAQRVHDRTHAPAKHRRRKMQLVAGALGLLAVIGIVSGTMMFLKSSKERDRKDKVAQMQDFVDKQQYDAALSFFASLQSADPELAADSTMVALHATAQKAIEKQDYRLERFEKLMRQASSDDPALIDESLLPQLEELAESDGERARVEDLKRRKEQYLKLESERQTDQMLGKLAELRNTFNQLQSRGGTPANLQALQNLLTSVVRLPNQFPLRGQDAVAKQSVLRDQVSSTLNRLKETGMIAEQRGEAIGALVSARTLDVYADLLRDYSTRSVSRTGFMEFGTVLDEESQWRDVDRTNAWLKELEQRLKSGVSSGEANQLIESAQELKRATEPNPVFRAMPDFTETMKEITGRRQILEDTMARISRHPLAKVVTLAVDDSSSPNGKTAYFLYADDAEANADRFSQSGSLGLEVISDELGGVRNRPFNGPLPKVLTEPMDTIADIVSQKTKQRINFDQYWERTLILLVADVRKRDDVDGLFKEWLIDQLLAAGVQGSEQLKSLIPQTMQILRRRTAARQRWYEPRPFDTSLNDQLDAMLRAEMPIALRRLSEPLSHYQAVASERLEWIGFLAKSASGQIEYHLRGPLPETDGKLYVAAPAESAANTSIVSVGELNQGHIRLSPNPVHQVPGRPIFLFPN
ncbi:hypothetical protein FYK55_22805 [Roseiconus nitratireducens]|uniref:Uncharacterized protein n=1 Tax=Roseiconus nitratireducens TaxID=2605748 RepID=A0A5M6D0S2_9BACT|nr:hypothetical protein [Roseiconus nitratireducens]KAA5539882.1 hypothetical protein FYK55_22805 [Roseiconus nitratireducens]